MTHTDFIKLMAMLYKPKSYLELGVYVGETFNELLKIVDKCVAVDTNKNFNSAKGEFFVGTTDSFFKNNIDIFDMIFIDADHDFDFIKRDLENSLKVLSNNGILLLHDTNPINKTFLVHTLCSDAYKIIDYFYNNYIDKYDIFTFPLTEAGITIITSRNNKRYLNFI